MGDPGRLGENQRVVDPVVDIVQEVAPNYSA